MGWQELTKDETIVFIPEHLLPEDERDTHKGLENQAFHIAGEFKKENPFLGNEYLENPAARLLFVVKRDAFKQESLALTIAADKERLAQENASSNIKSYSEHLAVIERVMDEPKHGIIPETFFKNMPDCMKHKGKLHPEIEVFSRTTPNQAVPKTLG